MDDLNELELVGGQQASVLREHVGAELGIGYETSISKKAKRIWNI